MTTLCRDQTDIIFGNGSYIISVAWQLPLSLSKVKLRKQLRTLFTEKIFLSSKAAQQSRAHPRQLGADLDDPSLTKVSVFSSSSAYLHVLFLSFLKKDILHN